MLMRYFMEFQKRTGSKLKLVLAGKKICGSEHPDILALAFCRRTKSSVPLPEPKPW